MTDIKGVFAGPNGLRPGWGIAIFVALLSILVAARRIPLGWIGSALGVAPHDPGSAQPLFELLREGSLAIVIAGATFIMARIEHRSPWSYGLTGRHSIRNFMTGALGGMVFWSVLMGIMALANAVTFDGWALHGFAVLQYGLIWAFFGVLVGFSEETVFRGYLQHTLARGIGFWPAALTCSIVFGLAHLLNAGESLTGIVVVILFAIFVSLCLKLTGSLWWGIGFHAALDWAEVFFYGTASSGNAVATGHLITSHPIGDARLSGGAVGPEGSFICVGLVLLLILLTAAATRLKATRARAITAYPKN
jgi:membrane protease YdiL (CAAX protease family)